MSEHNSLVASFASHSLAEATIRKLQESGLDKTRLSIISKDRERISREMGGATVLGGLDELDAQQAGCLPQESLLDYEAELKEGRVIAVVHGSIEDINRAKGIIDLTHPDGWDGKVGCTIYYGCVD